MINIQFTGHPPVTYQIDRSYNLPKETGMVRWNGKNKCLEVCGNEDSVWLKLDNTVEFHSDINMYEIAQWAMRKMKEEEKEKELRSKYPTLDKAYAELEFLKKLIADDIQQSKTS